MAARLKVFVTSDGLTDYVVAASSRPKALAAWGAHQDLFKTGGARETDDPTLVEAATARPGEVLRRPADSKRALAAVPRRAPRPKGPSKAALRKVAALEGRLADLRSRRDEALAEIEAARAALDVGEAKTRQRFEADEGKLAAALRDDRSALD
ncbi:MAG: hypothetical protein Q8Q88_18670 [Phenylobacterium sp.]|uniref:hypothetical protein n=1 Tax=Phenylobacterium sp. TaxID=1871053 RepID=UPI00273691A6|nr:hypothetical protein [Phenylobacterium sp.]MDP3749067.1 hypothetical protein [Phenylobacterium sp.]